MSTADYMLISDYVIATTLLDSKVLKAGSFVKPIDLRWVPSHLTNTEAHKRFNKKLETYAYTRFGIIVIPKHLIRKA